MAANNDGLYQPIELSSLGAAGACFEIPVRLPVFSVLGASWSTLIII